MVLSILRQNIDKFNNKQSKTRQEIIRITDKHHLASSEVEKTNQKARSEINRYSK